MAGHALRSRPGSERTKGMTLAAKRLGAPSSLSLSEDTRAELSTLLEELETATDDSRKQRGEATGDLCAGRISE